VGRVTEQEEREMEMMKKDKIKRNKKGLREK
jgi:hypothetical protein